MLLSHKRKLFSYRFFKASLWKVCEACPKIHLTSRTHPIFRFFIWNMNFFGSPERYNPHRFPGWPSANWYNWKESHSEQIYSVKKSALFNCSESDTFLVNYTIFEPSLHDFCVLYSVFNVHFLFILNTHMSDSILISVKAHPSFRTVSPYQPPLSKASSRQPPPAPKGQRVGRLVQGA